MSRPKQQNNKLKTNGFEIAIQEFEMKHNEFDSKHMIKICRNNKITSCHFSINVISKKEFCQNKCKIYKENKVKSGILLLLYQSLVNKYKIIGPCNLIKPDELIYSAGSLVFISPKCTKLMIDNEIIKEIESLNSSKRLFQYFKQMIRVNQINKYIKCYITQNKIKFIIINIELHNQQNDALYMICIKNDVISTKAQKWQFVKLMTEQQIIKLISNGSVSCLLPKGVRQNAPEFEKWRRYELISKDDICCNGNIYKPLKGIQTNYDKRRRQKGELTLTSFEFERCIQNALESNDSRHRLIPIINILSGKKYGDTYYVDQVLPVYVKGHWIGIVYRESKPVMLLFDVYDIANKAILCDPTFDTQTLSWFTNNICKINIKKSQIYQQSNDSNQYVQNLDIDSSYSSISPSQSPPNTKYSRCEPYFDDNESKVNVDEGNSISYNSTITTNNTMDTNAYNISVNGHNIDNNNTNINNRNNGIGGYQYKTYNNNGQQQINNYTTTQSSTARISEGHTMQTVSSCSAVIMPTNNGIDTNMFNTSSNGYGINDNNQQTVLSTNTNIYNQQMTGGQQYILNNNYYNNNYSTMPFQPPPPTTTTTRMVSEGQGIETMHVPSSDVIALQQMANIYTVEQLNNIAMNMGYTIIPLMLPLNSMQLPPLNVESLNSNGTEYMSLKPALSMIKEENELETQMNE